MAAFDVFVSYAHADRARVRELRDALVARGVRVWLDEDGIETFASISNAIDFLPGAIEAGSGRVQAAGGSLIDERQPSLTLCMEMQYGVSRDPA